MNICYKVWYFWTIELKFKLPLIVFVRKHNVAGLPVPKYIFSKVYLSENPCNKRMSYTYCTRIIDAHTSTSCFGRAELSSLLFFGMFFKARYYINIALSHTMNPESSYNTFDIEMIIKAQIPCDKNESRPEKYWTNDLHQSPPIWRIFFVVC